MEKTSNNFLGILGCAVLYAVTSFACAFLGFLSPWCWIVIILVLAAGSLAISLASRMGKKS